MANLIATGLDEKQYWRRELTMGEVIRLGRAPRQGWAVPWDVLVSREHADLELIEQGLQVRALETARNPILYREEPTTEFVAVKAAVTLGTILAAERLWRVNKVAAIALMVVSTGVLASVAANNARTLRQLR